MTKLLFGEEARNKILEGARKGAETIIPTLGPAGRNVAIRKKPIIHEDRPHYSPPTITKDGVTALNAILTFECPWEDIGLQMIKQAAQNTNRTGDGTTSSTLLAYEMMKGGKELLDKGANAIHVRRGMDKACEAVCENLKETAREIDGIEELTSIARISSQDDELADIVANAVMEVGKAGAVTLQAGGGSETEYKVTNGMQISTGYASHYFVNNPKNGSAQLKDAYILVTMDKIASIRDLAHILQDVRDKMDANEDCKGQPIKIVIFSTGVSGDALQTLAKNNVNQPDVIQCIVMNPPAFGSRQKEILEDVAISTGAKLIDKAAGTTVTDMGIAALGTCDSIIASEGVTTIVGSHGVKQDLTDRIGMLRAKLDDTEDPAEKDYLNSRIAGLDGKFANIYVGGNSETEQKEKMHRVEDAIAASKAAFESGILPGGGVAFLNCKDEIHLLEGAEDEKKGMKIVDDALSMQLWHVAKNAGEDPTKIIDDIEVGNHDIGISYGFNAETREYGDMFEMKVIDPARVPIVALKNAVSVAGSFLTIESSVDNE